MAYNIIVTHTAPTFKQFELWVFNKLTLHLIGIIVKEISFIIIISGQEKL